MNIAPSSVDSVLLVSCVHLRVSTSFCQLYLALWYYVFYVLCGLHVIWYVLVLFILLLFCLVCIIKHVEPTESCLGNTAVENYYYYYCFLVGVFLYKILLLLLLVVVVVVVLLLLLLLSLSLLLLLLLLWCLEYKESHATWHSFHLQKNVFNFVSFSFSQKSHVTKIATFSFYLSIYLS